MTAMQHSMWRNDLRQEGTEFLEEDGSERGLLGHIAERSTSAPPLPSGGENIPSAPFSFMSNHGQDDSHWFRNSRENRGSSSSVPPAATLSKRQFGQGSESIPLDQSNLYAQRKKRESSLSVGREGRATAPGTYHPPPLSEAILSPAAGCLSNSTPSQSFGCDSFAFERNREDVPSLIRSQSAAPELAHGRSSVPPPPGMSEIRNRGSESFLFDSTDDRETLIRAGPRRPASTGVIGQQNSSAPSAVISSLGLMPENMGGGAVRPAPKTLMDLIQEDFPKSPSPVYDSEYAGHRSGHLHSPKLVHDLSGNGYGGGQFQYSPCRPQPCNLSPEPQPSYPPPFVNGHETHQNVVPQDDNGLAGRVDRLQISSRQAQTFGASGSAKSMATRASEHLSSPRVQPQCAEAMPEMHAVHAPLYAASEHEVDHQVAQIRRVPLQQPSQYEQIMFYNSRAGGARGAGGSAMPTPTPTPILQSGHAVYLSPPAYGYTTLQYHPSSPHHQHLRVMHHPHQSIAGSLTTHEFVSLVPVQGGARTQVPAVSSNGTYTYWPQQDVTSATTGAAPAVAIVTSPLSRARSTSLVSSQGGRHGHIKVANGLSTRNAGEKGRNRRGGLQSHRRVGGNSDNHSKHSVGGTVTSSVLDEFRAAKNREWTVTDIKGHIVEFCQDQNGSRLIQQRLEIGDATEQLIVMDEVLPAVRLLRNDVFGNYVVQKLLERGTAQMKIILRDTLGGEMLPLSLQMYGCRVVQKALETLDEGDLPSLLMEFHHNVLSCIHDQNGNHVIQKCIEVISKRARKAKSVGDGARAEFLIGQIDFVVEDVLGNVTALSCHPYGCRVLQRILEHCDGTKKSRALDEISRCHRLLLDDQYGNYVIQHVLQYGRYSDRESILNIVVDSGLLTLSKQKFASNVVEKLLQYGTPEQRNVIVREMLKVVDEDSEAQTEDGPGRSSVVLLMVRDAYANYVVQTTLDVVPEGEEKLLLLEELKSHSSQLRNYAFAKHIATKLSN